MTIQDQITAAAQKYGIDPNLALAVAKTESSLNPNAISSAGAVGVMQLMGSSFPGVNIYDTSTNIDTGVSYLSQLLNQYNGNVNMALAAYNTGPGTVSNYGITTAGQSYIDKVMAWFNLGGGGGALPSDTTSGITAAGVDLSSPLILVGIGIIGAWALSKLL